MPICPLLSDNQAIDISEEGCIQISIINFVYEKSRPLYSALQRLKGFATVWQWWKEGGMRQQNDPFSHNLLATSSPHLSVKQYCQDCAKTLVWDFFAQIK